jgi:uncharacterized protein (TIGR02147 family)
MHPATDTPIVFDYLNAREFIGDFLEWAKRKPGFTHRALLEKIGVSSTGFLANVISGKSNLNPQQAKALAEIFFTLPNEGRFFQTLVAFTQARLIEEKGDALDSLRIQVRNRNKKLDPRQYSLFSKWLYPMVFELVGLIPISENFREVADYFETTVKPDDVKKALEVLETLELILKTETGVYQQARQTLKTGDDVISTDIVKYQQTVLKKAMDALDTTDASERSISATTLPLSQKGLEQVKIEAQRFRDKLLKISEDDTKSDCIYMLSVNLFPGTKRIKRPEV